MPRQRFEKELRKGSVLPLGLPKEAMGESVQTRWHGKLTAQLIEGFVLRYLHYKYDNPLPTPQFHREIWTACADESKKKVLAIAPRGHAKSTSITEAYGLAALLFRQRDFAIILSNTYGQSVEFLGDILTELEENDALRADFQIGKILRGAEDNVIVQMKDSHKIRIVARGAEQKVRGVKWNKRRPNLVLCDDLEDDEQVANAERREKFRKWFLRAVLPFGADDALFRVGATILHFDSLAQRLSDPKDRKDKAKVEQMEKGWFTLRYKAHQSFSDFSNILWPEKFPEARLRSIRQDYIDDGDRDGYSQEYLNIPIAEGESYFRESDLLPMEDHDRLRPLRKYAAWDFAISKKQGSDYTVGVVIGIDESGMIYVVDVRRGRWDSKEIIDEMFSVQKAHNCLCHYAEAGVIEKAIGPYLYDEMARRANDGEDTNFFNIEPVLPVLDKVQRATSWRAVTRARRVKYDQQADWWSVLREEMLQFPKGPHDDQIDPQSILGLQLQNLIVAPTSEELEQDAYAARFGSRQERASGRSATTGY